MKLLADVHMRVFMIVLIVSEIIYQTYRVQA